MGTLAGQIGAACPACKSNFFYYWDSGISCFEPWPHSKRDRLGCFSGTWLRCTSAALCWLQGEYNWNHIKKVNAFSYWPRIQNCIQESWSKAQTYLLYEVCVTPRAFLLSPQSSASMQSPSPLGLLLTFLNSSTWRSAWRWVCSIISFDQTIMAPSWSCFYLLW